MPLTRKFFSLILEAVLLSLVVQTATFGHSTGKKFWVYVGTYTGKGSEGIYAYEFDAVTGKVRTLGLAAKTPNPSFLAVNATGTFLYAVNEIESFENQSTGAVSAFSIDPKSGKLRFLQQVSSLGSGPAHLSLDRSGHYVMVANYGGGNVSVFPIGPDGRLGKNTAFMQAQGSSIVTSRQASPHAHFIQTTPDNRWALVAGLGIDKLLVYDFSEKTGALSLDSSKVRALEPGAGPRHIAMEASGKHIYVANELSSSVTHFVCNAGGLLEMKETVSTLPKGFRGQSTVAEIVMDARGRYLYVSNRGDDSIVLFAIGPEDGSLVFADRVPCGGKTPRNIALDPTGRWLFSANQNSNAITLFGVDQDSGRLTRLAQSMTVVAPVCVTLVTKQ